MLRAEARSKREKCNRMPKITTEIRIYNTDASLIGKCIEVIRRVDIVSCLEDPKSLT